MARHANLCWSSLATLGIGLLSVGPVGILAQSTNASCLSSFDWMNNSKGQNPCLVGAYLQGACNGGGFTISALPPNTHYAGPSPDQQNSCQCSSVTYSVISACGACQNQTIITWSTWCNSCSIIYPGVFPLNVPGGTAVPRWAFQDVTASDLFNVTLAQLIGDDPESVSTLTQSVVSATSGTSTLASASSSAAASVSSPVSSGSKSHTGTIAGGVVGGLVGVALIAGAVVFFVVKRTRSQVPPSAQFTNDRSSLPIPLTYTSAPSFVPRTSELRLYDPSDPSTFPLAPPLSSVRTGSSRNVSSSPLYSTSSGPSGHLGGSYPGTMEI